MLGPELVWKRHTNQILKSLNDQIPSSSYCSCTSPRECNNIVYDVPANVPINFDIPKNVVLEDKTEKTVDFEGSNPFPVVQNKEIVIPIKVSYGKGDTNQELEIKTGNRIINERPKRTIKKPVRLDL